MNQQSDLKKLLINLEGNNKCPINRRRNFIDVVDSFFKENPNISSKIKENPNPVESESLKIKNLFIENPNLYQCALQKEIEKSLSKNALNALKQDLVTILSYDYYSHSETFNSTTTPNENDLPEVYKLLNANMNYEQKQLINKFFSSYNDLEENDKISGILKFIILIKKNAPLLREIILHVLHTKKVDYKNKKTPLLNVDDENSYLLHKEVYTRNKLAFKKIGKFLLENGGGGITEIEKIFNPVNGGGENEDITIVRGGGDSFLVVYLVFFVLFAIITNVFYAIILAVFPTVFYIFVTELFDASTNGYGGSSSSTHKKKIPTKKTETKKTETKKLKLKKSRRKN